MNNQYKLKLLLIAILGLFAENSWSQIKVGTNPTSIQSTSILELEHTGKGLLLPRLTTAQATAMIATADANNAQGLLIYNTTIQCIQQFSTVGSGSWNCLSTAGKVNLPSHADTTAANTVSPAYQEGDVIYDESCGCTVIRKGGTWVPTSAEPWYNAATLKMANSNTQNIYQMGRVGINTNNPGNKLEIKQGTTGNSGLRFTNLTNSYAPTKGATRFLSVNATGDVVLAKMAPDIIDFNVNIDPNTVGTTFVPNTPQDGDALYVSSINDDMWTWDGTAYVSFNPPQNTEWNLSNTGKDAMGNKTKMIRRTGSVVIGNANSHAVGTHSLAVGISDSSVGTYSFTAGSLNKARAGQSIALGSSNIVTSTGTNGFAVGSTNVVSGISAVALGQQSRSEGGTSIAIGYLDTADGTRSVAIGQANYSGSSVSLALGQNNRATGGNSTAIGYNNRATNLGSVAIGYLNRSTGFASTSMGYSSDATASYAIAMGYQDTASGNYAVALGNNNLSSGANAFSVGASNISSGSTSTAMGYFNRATSNYAMALGFQNTVSSGSGSGAWAFGYVNKVTGDRGTALGAQNFVSGGLSSALGVLDTATGSRSVAIGDNSNATGSSCIAIGYGTLSSSTASFAGGAFTKATGAYSTSFGYSSDATNSYTVAMGYQDSATGSYAVAIGNNNLSSGTNAFSVGSTNNSTGGNSVAIGTSNRASGTSSLILGANSKVSGNYSSTIGYLNNSTSANSYIMGESNTINSTQGNNYIFGYQSNISVGIRNTIVGYNNSISFGNAQGIFGGQNNSITAGSVNTILGGSGNEAQGTNNAILGGSNNSSTGTFSIVGGSSSQANNRSFAFGLRDTANSSTATASVGIAMGLDARVIADGGLAFGRAIRITHNMSAGFGDGNGSVLGSSAANQMNMRYAGGYRLFTNAGMTLGAELTAGATAWTALSDRTVKENIVNNAYGLKEVMQLGTYTYNYIGNPTTQRNVGFIAQEVKTLMPEVVDNLSNGKIGIRYTEMIPVLTKAIQEQQALILQLQVEMGAFTK